MNVIMCYPDTEEGKQALRERVAQAHAEGIIKCIQNYKCSDETRAQMFEYLQKKVQENLKNMQNP